jgi:hypothetical protein
LLAELENKSNEECDSAEEEDIIKWVAGNIFGGEFGVYMHWIISLNHIFLAIAGADTVGNLPELVHITNITIWMARLLQ